MKLRPSKKWKRLLIVASTAAGEKRAELLARARYWRSRDRKAPR